MKYSITILLLFISTGLVAQIPQEYYKIAAENNPGLLSSYKEFEAAMQKVPQVSSMPDPNLSFGYFISPVETRVGPQVAKFSLTQAFPWFGILKTQGQATALLAEAKYQSFLNEKNKLYFQLAASYYPLMELNELQKLETENQDILQSLKTIASSKYQNGSASMVDVIRAELMLNESQTELAILSEKKNPLQSNFNSLLNRQADDSIFISDTLEYIPLVNEITADSLLNHQPLLSEMDAKVQAAEKSEILAKKQGMPKLGFGIDYVIVGKQKDMVVAGSGKDAIMPMVSLSIPLNRSKYKAAISESEIMQESYQLKKTEISNQLQTNYQVAQFDIQKQEDLIQLYEKQIEQSNQALNLLLSAYSSSGKDFDDVLRMQQQVLKYKKLRVTAISQYAISQAKLNYITAKNLE